MWKKLLTITIIIIALLGCAVWSPWKSIGLDWYKLVGLEAPVKFARLQITSLAGELEIYVDGESKGSVGPEGSPFLVEDITPGQRLVKLVRRSDNAKNYIQFERLVNFSSDVDTVIAYELGPNQEFSEGHIITAFKNYANQDLTRLNVTMGQEDVLVTLDNNSIGKAPIQSLPLDNSSVHKLKLEKAGYEPLEISLLPQDEADRRKLTGYDITVEAFLFLQPLRVT